MQPPPQDLLSRAGPASTLAQRLKLSDPARALLRADIQVRPYVDALVGANLHADALRMLARALPRRESVWWACQSVRSSKVILPSDEPVLAAAEKWATSATDDHRRAAFAAGQQIEFDTPAGLCALAAFWSGGSMAPPKLPVVQPAEHLCPDMVVHAVLLAGLLAKPEILANQYAQFIALAFDVASGSNRWKEERPVAVRR